MSIIAYITLIASILVLAHGIWVLAYSASSRRILQERLEAYASASHSLPAIGSRKWISRLAR
jgi:hypothetical protein